MKLKRTIILITFLIALSCVEPFDLPVTGTSHALVVEGIFSNQLKRHQVLLSRATPLHTNVISYEPGATVTISDQNGNIIPLTEETPGRYLTPEIAADPAGKYTLNIRTADGREYASREVPFKDGPELTDVYGRYVKNDDNSKGIGIFVDTEDPANETHFYRWNYAETYEVHAPFPSNWIWLGGNEVEFRHDGIDTCYVTDTLRHVLVRDTRTQEQDKVVAQSVRFIPEDSYIMREKYSILVEQFCLSEEAYSYWDNLRKVHEEQGSLSDLQPGSLAGNMTSLSNENETVLGYFEACKVSEKRIFMKPIDFYDDGFLRPKGIRTNCLDLTPIDVHVFDLGETMERYKGTLYIWEVTGLYPATTFFLLPKECCDCRNLGPTERPPFF